MTITEEVQSEIKIFEQAALAHTRAASALHEAAQATEDGDDATAKERSNAAQYYADQAKEILDTL